MCANLWAVRVHVYLDDALVQALDAEVGARERSAFIEEAVRKELDNRRRWRLIWSAVGSISDDGHPWDPDPAAWVRETRRRETQTRETKLREAWRS